MLSSGAKLKSNMAPFTVARRPRPQITLRSVRNTLRSQIKIIGLTYMEKDGVVRDSEAIRSILCLRKALDMLPRQ